jgi:hypothetical protein
MAAGTVVNSVATPSPKTISYYPSRDSSCQRNYFVVIEVVNFRVHKALVGTDTRSKTPDTRVVRVPETDLTFIPR